MIKNAPCEWCSDEVGDNYDSVQCDLCNKWNHTRCLNIDAEQYEKVKKDPLPWYCPNYAVEKTFREVSQLFDQSENSVSFDYYTPYELNKIKVKQEDLSVLHLNVSSLSAHIGDLKNFLSELRTKFDKICISESRLSQKNSKTTNINLAGYNIEQTPTGSLVGAIFCIYLKSSPINHVKTYKSIVPRNLNQSLFLTSHYSKQT